VLPVGHPREQDLVEVAEHVRERLAVLRRRRRQARANLSRLDAGEHRKLGEALEIAGGPLKRGMTIVEEARRWLHCGSG
jgi:hypothetical protein